MKGLLNKHRGVLSNLMQEAELFQALLEVGQDALPPELKPHLIGVSFEQRTLILQIDDNIWATQLRFYEPDLLGIYQRHFPHLQLNRSKVQVIPIQSPPTVKRPVSSKPSESDAEQMREIGEQTGSERLKKALFKLSQRAEEEQESD